MFYLIFIQWIAITCIKCLSHVWCNKECEYELKPTNNGALYFNHFPEHLKTVQ